MEKEKERRGPEREEEDLLARSIKKPKENGIEDSTMDDNMSDKGLESKNEEEVKETSKESAVSDPPNTTPRKLISYKDIVLQLNGEEEDPDSDEEDWKTIQRKEEEADGMDEDEEAEVQISPLYPVYRFSANKHKDECKKWRSALIVKLLGKKLATDSLSPGF